MSDSLLSAGDAEIKQTVLVIEAISKSAGGASLVQKLGVVVSRCTVFGTRLFAWSSGSLQSRKSPVPPHFHL